jgi:pyruvate/2-oxoglutarate dehydrogenase complex dihydrolipoamide dehydrogenase (E3) component
VSLNQQRFIQMGERLATAAVRIWALGEAAGSPMLTHVALDDYRVTKSVILGGKPHASVPAGVTCRVYRTGVPPERDGGASARHALPSSVLYGSP